MLTADYTFAYTDTGVILNSDPVVSTSPFVDVSKVTGLSNAEYRTTERDREGMDGGFIDALYEKIRTIILEGTIYNVTESYLDSLKANFAPSATAQPFYFDAPGISERVIFCKSLGIKYDWDTARRIGMTPFQIQLKAEDPTIYGAPIASSVGLTGSETGFGFNLGFNFGFGGTTSAAGNVVLNNAGNKPTDCTFTITGPVTNPVIVHDNTGNKLSFSIVLGSTDTLTVNLRNKTVYLNGTANRRATLLGTSRWFMLAPSNNSIRFQGTAGAGTPLLATSHRPAYR